MTAEPTGARLGLAQKLVARVVAAYWWNATQLEVTKGEQYHIVATGEWHDARACTTAAGYSSLLLSPFMAVRRVPSAQWFSLIAAVHSSPALESENTSVSSFVTGWCESRKHQVSMYDRQSDLSEVGVNRTLMVRRDGYLYLFANDAPFAYGNNRGAVQVEIVRMA